MDPRSSSRTFVRIGLAGVAALVLAAPAGARILPVDEYSWGAAATYAKQQTSTVAMGSADAKVLAQYGWGAAATYAKLHA